MVIDLFGLTAEEVRKQFPSVYQHVVTHVKPERDTNSRASYRERWWVFGEPRKDLRPALKGLSRYIATTETSKHRFFQFLSEDILPDNMIVAIALDDGFHLGVLSSRAHVVYAVTAGGRLGVGNDPRYNKSRCFDPFPFPACDAVTQDRVRKIAEELDAHRKRVQAESPELTLTGMYNVLEKLRANEALNKKEQRIHDLGLVSVLRQFHDDLDAAVFAAYGWPVSLTDEEILERIVALNAERAAEEASGLIRWLRPEYQHPEGAKQAQQSGLDLPPPEAEAKPPRRGKPGKPAKLNWPEALPDRVKAVSILLGKSKEPLTADQIAACFLNARRANVEEILETLCTMGQAHRGKSKGAYLP
jgi:hypothetical protein